MSGYFGTQMQRRLQAQAEASVDFIHATPGACQTGRTMGCDDPDQLGWGRIDAFLSTATASAASASSRPAKADELSVRPMMRQELPLRYRGTCSSPTALARSLPRGGDSVSGGLPAGLTDLDRPHSNPRANTRPASRRSWGQPASCRSPARCSSGSLGAGDDRRLSATETGPSWRPRMATSPHNAHSAYHRHAWGGLVAVAESQRGKGLGNYINARMVVSVFRDLDAAHVYELVSASDSALPAHGRSQAGCGPSRLSCAGSATPSETARFTR